MERFDVKRFIAEQRLIWPLLHTNIVAMEQSLRKEVITDHGKVIVQCIPERIKSTTANVSTQGILARPCFLCPEHRIKGQQTYSWGLFDILGNPYPIVSNHLTIVSKQHQPQQIIGFLPDFLQIACLLEGYVVFYNAPLSGASAPDHLHFQAGDGDELPYWEDIVLSHFVFNDVDIALLNGLRRHIRLSGKDAQQVIACTRKIISLFPERWKKSLMGDDVVLDYNNEPEWNGFCRYKDGLYQLDIFPRTERRPKCYFMDEPNKLLVSPGALDMAGILVAPRKQDFDKIGPKEVFAIYDEVSPSQIEMESLFNAIASQLA